VSLQIPPRAGRRGAAAAENATADGAEPTGQQPGSAANNGIMYDTVVLEMN